MSKAISIDSLTEKTRAVIEYYLANPTKTQQVIAKEVGVSYQRVSQILRSPKVTALYPILARRHVQANLLPKAMQAYDDLLRRGTSEQVREKAAGRILSSEKVLQDGKSDSVTVNVKADITLRDVRELRQIVDNAASLPQNVIDSELVDEKDA